MYKVNEKTVIRFALEEECGLILSFIRELAQYEGMLEEVSATEELLRESLFRQKKAEVLFVEYEGQAVGFALFFHNYSTFLGKPGLYLEDLFVRKEYRKLGLGKALFSALAKTALDRDCGRMEWWCLDWNRKSIDFYLGLGAEAMTDWTVYRLTGEEMAAQAKRLS